MVKCTAILLNQQIESDVNNEFMITPTYQKGSFSPVESLFLEHRQFAWITLSPQIEADPEFTNIPDSLFYVLLFV
jgi:hypothetical protein